MKMAKFCTKCGKPLKDGKPCDCESKAEKASKKEEAVTKNIWEQIVMVFKGGFKKPHTTMDKTTNGAFLWTSLIAIGASAIGLCLVIIRLLKVIYASSVNAVGSSLGLGNSLGNATSLGINIPLTVFIIILLVALFYFVYTIIGYVFTNKIFKNKNNYKEIVSSMAVPAMISTVFSLGSWLLMLLFGTFGLLGVSAGSILAGFYRYQALLTSSHADKDKSGYIILAAQMIAIIAVVIILSAISYNSMMNVNVNSLF